MTVRWGILSTARINQKFIVGCAQSEELRIEAVASRDRERARAYADEHGIERAYGDYDELLADPEIDAVYVSLPNALHLEWAERALRAGKHVLCEKPLARDAALVTAAFDLAEREDLILMEAFMYRHNPQIGRLVELVRVGTIGRLRLIRSSFGFNLSDPGNVRLTSALDGGSLMDVGCYCVNATRLLAGEPERVTGQQLLGADGIDLAFVGTMRFAEEVVAHFDCGFVLPDRGELEVIGENGSLYLADPWHARAPTIEVRTEAGIDRVRCSHADSYQLEAENMAAAIRGEARPLLGRDDAVGQAGTIAALYASANRGGEEVSHHRH